MNGSTASAIFNEQADAQRAVSELRDAGVPERALSVVSRQGGTTTTAGADGETTEEEHGSVVRGILGGGALGAGLGVAALAIPGVGPLVAAGAIAASAVPGAMAIGAAAGAAAGTLNETLAKHGVDRNDAEYYGTHLEKGGVLVLVDTSVGGLDHSAVIEILDRNGGHSSARTRTAAL